MSSNKQHSKSLSELVASKYSNIATDKTTLIDNPTISNHTIGGVGHTELQRIYEQMNENIEKYTFDKLVGNMPNNPWHDFQKDYMTDPTSSARRHWKETRLEEELKEVKQELRKLNKIIEVLDEIAEEENERHLKHLLKMAKAMVALGA